MKGNGKAFILSAADKILGRRKRRHVNWFAGKREVLEGSIKKRNELHAIWLSSKRDIDKRRYVAQRRLVAQMVRRAKNECFQQKAQQIERGMEKGVNGRMVWQGIRDIHHGKAGLDPVQTSEVRDPRGELSKGTSLYPLFLYRGTYLPSAAAGTPS